MKHLLRFSEGNSSDIKEMASDYLSYLLDKGYSLDVEKYTGSNYDTNYDIEITADGYWIDEEKRIEWLDIKDDIIQFIQFLYKNGSDYTLLKVVMYSVDSDDYNDGSTLTFESPYNTLISCNIKTLGCLSIYVK